MWGGRCSHSPLNMKHAKVSQHEAASENKDEMKMLFFLEEKKKDFQVCESRCGPSWVEASRGTDAIFMLADS